MLTILNESVNPYFNLALEEYVLKQLDVDEDFILLWQNEPSIIIGRNQNTIEEINSAYVKEHNINVVRRNSGGGTVYHDFGNLNFSYISKSTKDNVHNFRKFTDPVINALNHLGVKAEFSGRNDITVDGKKISGNAQSYYRNKMLHHGTILFDSDLDMITKVLDVKLEKIESKGIKSVRSRVTNIKPYLTNQINMDEFKHHLLVTLLGDENIRHHLYQLTEEDLEKINELVKNKYSTWEWNYGESPKFDIQKTGRFAGGKIDIRLNVVDGLISNSKIYGDFFGTKDIHELELALLHHRYEENEIREVLNNNSLNDYFYNISIDDFINCLFY